MARPPDHAFSPLRLVTREPAVHELMSHLRSSRDRLARRHDEPVTLTFSRARVAATRDAFNRSIRRGESVLHRLCDEFTSALMSGRCDRASVVIAELPGTGERLRIEHLIARDTLYEQTDLALGMSVLERLRVAQGDAWLQPRLVANYVEYLPLEAGDPVIHKIVSRIKAEEEIWNKVVDELFDIDSIVARDKQLARHSRYVKDVFGVKVVVGTPADARQVHDWLVARCHDGSLRVTADGEPLRLLEIKDYLDDHDKRSGWKAIKSVLAGGSSTLEVQVQPLDNHIRELHRLTEQSHAAFKQKRDALRDEVAQSIPLFGYYRELLRWLFQDPSGPPPHLEQVEVTWTP